MTAAASTSPVKRRAAAAVLGDDGLGVAGAVAADVLEGGVEVVDDADRHLQAVELGVVVLLRDRVVGDARGVGLGAGLGVGVEDDALPRERRERLGEELGGDGPVDEERLGGVAHARAGGSWS